MVTGATDHLANDLADRIIQFLELTPEDRQKMRLASRETAERYTITKNAEVIVNTLAQ